MKPIALLITGVVSVATAALVAIVGLVAIGVGGAGTAIAATQTLSPSPEAVADIPAALLPRFIAEAAECAGLPWTALAAVSKAASDHGRIRGRTVATDGFVAPPIVSPPLDGSNGGPAITDTDDGVWDADTHWDHQVGPFAFLPTQWRLYGGDASGDGIADPHNINDAIGAARRRLCPEGHIDDITAALRAYDNRETFVADVLEWIARYSAPATADGHYALPVARDLVDDAALVAPHHDYPAWDLSVPVGTTVYAVTTGTVVSAFTEPSIYPSSTNRCGSTIVITGNDGAQYVYCHLHAILVAPDQPVTAGSVIGQSGGQPGAPGAGNTTGPHLHLAIRIGSRSICPQPVLLAIAKGDAINVGSVASAGCITGQPQTDWNQWLSTACGQRAGGCQR